MKFVLLLAFLFMWLANPITGFLGFNNPEKWMKRAIRKLQRKTNAYGTMIASNTDEISNTAGFISTIDQCENNYINDPDNGLSCCFEDNLNKGQCLCNGMTIDDTSNPGTCCMANKEHPDHCLCSGTDMDDPTNPGNCCFANSGQCLCKGNYTDVPSKRCFNLDWKGDGICDDQNNHGGCNFDGGDCCGDNVDTDLCTQCQCLEEEDPLPNAVGCCFKRENNSQECLCTGTQIDDPETPGSCCLDDVDNPGNCYRTCPDDCTNSSQGICDTSTGICDCKPGFAGHNCAEACTANQISNADICQDCPVGKVPDVMSNLTACIACNSGEISNNGSCKACPSAGEVPDSTQSTCIMCPTGEVPDTDLTTCVACNPEEITNNGSCQACPEGQAPNANQTVCEEVKEQMVCKIGFGAGTGRHAHQVSGSYTIQECIDAVKQQWPTANGATLSSCWKTPNTGCECYAEFKMQSWSGGSYLSCLFIDANTNGGGALITGPTDFGAPCPSPTYEFTDSGVDYCCCGASCCWDKCESTAPPAACLQSISGGEWRYSVELGYFQAFATTTGVQN